MKIIRQFSVLAAAAALCLLCACGSQPDAGVLFREAKSDAETMKSCSAAVSSTLSFAANNRQHAFYSTESITFSAKPFTLKTVQSSTNDGASDHSETYTVTQNGGVWFYCKNGTGWQKTSSENLDPSPTAQIDILSLLNSVEDEKYVRETSVGKQKVHKIELKLKSEVLRSTIENIVTASGMGDGSATVVQTLLDSAPPVYGYCYIDESSGQMVQLELNTAEAADKIFQNIDGTNVKINVTQCETSGSLSGINQTQAAVLPKEAQSASAVQALG